MMQNIFSNWDAKDTRNVFIGLLLLVVPYSLSIMRAVSNLFVAASLLVSNRFVDYLYGLAAYDPTATNIVSMQASFLFAPVIICTCLLGMILLPKAKSLVELSESAQRSKGTKRLPFLIALYVMLLANAVVGSTIFVYPVAINRGFHQHMEALSDVLTDAEKNRLVSIFARIASKRDYDQIEALLKSYSEIHGRKFHCPC